MTENEYKNYLISQVNEITRRYFAHEYYIDEFIVRSVELIHTLYRDYREGKITYDFLCAGADMINSAWYEIEEEGIRLKEFVRR